MREVGMLVTQNNFSLITIFGEPTMVNFPVEYALEIHKKFPGLIQTMAHSHPNGMTDLSEEDRTTLKAWTYAFSPHRIFMDVICETKNRYSWKVYDYELESLEDWKKRGGKGERNMELQKQTFKIDRLAPRWIWEIISLSYDLEEGQ